MKQLEALSHFLKTLNSLRAPYMITGAYAVSFHGAPRSTHDIDVVIEIKPQDIGKICLGLKNNYIIDKAMIENAVKFHTHFSIIHSKSDFRADFWILKDKAVEQAKFKRRQKISLFGISTYVISAEDIIVTKLEWYKRFKNSKHLDDVIGIIRVQGKKLDFGYIVNLLDELGIKKCWETAVKAGNCKDMSNHSRG